MKCTLAYIFLAMSLGQPASDPKQQVQPQKSENNEKAPEPKSVDTKKADAKTVDPKKVVKLEKFEVPYQLINTKHVMVRMKMNGKGPYNFIMDTGAPMIVTTTKVSSEIDLKIKDDHWGYFDSLVLEGGHEIKDARARVENLFQLQGMNALGVAGHELHGVIGYEVLSRYRITYDFTKDKLEFEPLDYAPEKLAFKGKGGGQGMLDILGPIMKTFAAFSGINPDFNPSVRGFTGVTFKDSNAGIVVDQVFKNSPAEHAGLKPGDLILSSKDGEEVKLSKAKDLALVSENLKVGDQLKLKIKRDSAEKEMIIDLGRGF